MRIRRHITQCISLSLIVLTVLSTTPVSGADFTSKTNIGSVSAVGSVQLRGIPINSEGTLFSGDPLNVGSGSYAKLVLSSGPKVEVGAGSAVTVSREADGVSIQMSSGNIAFTGNGQKPVHVRLGTYDLTAAGLASGTVAFMGPDAFGVRIMNGTVSVRNSTTKQSYTVSKGTERLFSLRSDSNQSLVQLASNAPTAIPAAPTAPQGAPMSGGKLALLVGTLLGAGAVIAILIAKNDDSDDEAAGRLAKAKALSNISAVSATAGSTNTASATVNTSATNAPALINANATIPAAQKPALVATANSLASRSAAARAAIISIAQQIDTLRAQIDAQPGGPTAAQLGTLNLLISQLETQRVTLNQIIVEFNAFIAQVNSLAGSTLLTNPGLQPIPPANIASQSAP